MLKGMNDMNPKIFLTIIFSFLITSCSDVEHINEKNIHEHVKKLSSDEFEGREPGTLGLSLIHI